MELTGRSVERCDAKSDTCLPATPHPLERKKLALHTCLHTKTPSVINKTQSAAVMKRKHRIVWCPYPSLLHPDPADSFMLYEDKGRQVTFQVSLGSFFCVFTNPTDIRINSGLSSIRELPTVVLPISVAVWFIYF